MGEAGSSGEPVCVSVCVVGGPHPVVLDTVGGGVGEEGVVAAEVVDLPEGLGGFPGEVHPGDLPHRTGVGSGGSPPALKAGQLRNLEAAAQLRELARPLL